MSMKYENYIFELRMKDENASDRRRYESFEPLQFICFWFLEGPEGLKRQPWFGYFWI